MFRTDPDAAEFGVTAVENLFIRNFLPSAKGDQVKVYLWGLYQSARENAFETLEEAAEELNMTPDAVASALRYWERRGLVTIQTEDPPVFVFHSPRQRASSPSGFEPDPAYADFAESVYAAFGSRRKVRPSEVSQAWEWVQDLGLSPEAVLMLINHMIDYQFAISREHQFDFEEERLAKAFANLPVQRQQILTMLFVEERKPEEIARLLHCSVQHVYDQRYQTIRKLRKVLTEEDHK